MRDRRQQSVSRGNKKNVNPLVENFNCKKLSVQFTINYHLSKGNTPINAFNKTKFLKMSKFYDRMNQK